eukprot:Blabericola_migrator_1__10749@NODE_615_length_7273_cov_113_689564_g448_i0_p2_GENE_NODE_615_length_7273_cov_113_689564_g448_i0NODE_615_length_7273_cov_113_689564_g448_i0_p2_ORF_typecomplete_len784_score134_58Glycos_transf_2/PF00535_26/9_8e24Glyco_tranf_2_3/PF13641_6/2_4e21Glyco_transf_7C/PF02709_14/2_8e13Glyco_tranf_2_2/PF10111_9/1_2e09Ricin_B_lectin/PF00652_22/5_1e06Glyco_transf_21/PF13506_6/0_007ODVE18/PF10717_9/0_3TPR_21/PF09976_9/0_46_NODE_615_length_7273_cov_113_689564_g448_i039986349
MGPQEGETPVAQTLLSPSATRSRKRAGDLEDASPVEADPPKIHDDLPEPHHKPFHWSTLSDKLKQLVYTSRNQLSGINSTHSVIILLVLVVIVWLVMQSVIVEVSVNAREARKFQPGRKLANPTGGEFADEMAKAFSEWKLIQEKFPNSYANFSQFLIQEKVKEKNLRARISKLSKKSLSKISDIIVPPAQPPPKYSKEEDSELKWTYLSMEKAWPYVGSDRYLDRFRPQTRHYYNSLAVFPHSNRTRLHGLVGLYPNGTRAWKGGEIPSPIANMTAAQKAEEIKDGGFYLKLSNALPLDRDIPDTRDDFCQDEVYNIEEYPDVSVIITFYNEHASTLLRSVHSVLNYTPPPLLREVILVDDHSNNTANAPGGYVYDYIKLLPKVKLMRLPERRGLVQARLAGAKLAKAPVLVVLDSHIEVNPVWLEPQLKRLNESPRSVVFPQILALDSETLEWRTDSGIGCFLSFKWVMQERPYFQAQKSAAPVASPSMAGGLFAVRRDWFFESGAYDEEFSMWGAENVEMGFRHWMCGGRVECTPCARTYHIYRHGGSGYKSPGEFIKKNRIRTARLWLDEYYQIARYFNDDTDVDQGSYEKMLELKDRLQCKNFQWFLDNVDPTREGTSFDDFGLMGELRNLGNTGSYERCVDNLGHRFSGEHYGSFACHGMGGSQGWFEIRSSHRIRNMSNENNCLGHDMTLTYCEQDGKDNRWRSVPEKKWIAWAKTEEALKSDNFEEDYECLGLTGDVLEFKPCTPDDLSIQWQFKIFESDPSFKPLSWDDVTKAP